MRPRLEGGEHLGALPDLHVVSEAAMRPRLEGGEHAVATAGSTSTSTPPQ